MSNTLFKKVTATAAALSIVLSIVSPVVGVKAADASTDAANRLAALGVIVDNSTDPSKYNLGSNITRREMLKVMMNLSSVEVGTTCEWKFSDLPASDWGCKYAEAALKAGFIAANPKFRPNDMVTEAEALKMVMQARGLAKKDGVADWADAYRQAAVEAGILAADAKVSTKAAKRSFTIVTADAAVTSTTGETADNTSTDDLGGLFGDLFGDEGSGSTMSGSTETSTSTGTSTVDNGTVVASGDLDVSLNPASAANGTQVPGTGSIRFASVDFTAGKSDVSVNTVEIKSLGLAEVPSSTKVWFEKNGKRLSGKASFSSERTAVTSFAPAYVVKAGSTETLDMYVELSTAAGSDFQFSGKVTSSSAASVKGGFTTNTLRTAAYTVAPVTFNVAGSNNTVNQSSDTIELGRFTVANNDASSETRDVKFQTITLRQLGNGDLADLTDIVLERNGAKVSTETSVSGKDVTFVINDTIKDGGTTATYYVKAKVATVQNNAGDTYQFSLRNDTDLNAVEVLNGFRSTVTRTASTLNTYTINGADITFARDSSVELSKTYAKGSSDVVFMKGTITSKSAITLEDPTLTITGTTDASALFSTLYLQIGSSTMSWSATATGTAKFSGVATVNGTATVKVYAKLKDTATSADVKFDDLRLGSFDKKEYVSNQNTVQSAVGSIPWVQVTIGTTNLSVTRVDGLGDTKIAVGSKAVLANEVSLSVTQGNNVNISNATYTVTASGSYSNNSFATLYVDGVAVSTKTVSGSTVTFDNVSKVVSSTAVKLAVKVDFSDAYTDGDFSIRLTSLDAVDTITSGSVTPNYPTAAKLTVASAIGTLSSSDANPKASLLLAGAKDQKLLAFRVKASNDAVKLRDVKFSGTGLANLSNFRILTPASKYLTATTSSGTAVEFTNIADTDNYSVAMDKTETFYLVADVNTNVNSVNNLAVSIVASTSKVKSTNGTLSALVGSDVASNTHAIEENTAVVAKATNSSKDINTSALRFTVTASGKDSVTLSGATFDNVLSGYTGATTLTVYKDSVSVANIVGTGSTTGVVSFTGNKTVDSGSTNTYIVVINGTVDATANTPSWTVRLSSLQVVTGTSVITTSSYNNMGEFPITETK